MTVRAAADQTAGATASKVARVNYAAEYELARIPVAVLNLDFRFQNGNEVFQREVGIPNAELTGKSISDLWAFDPTEHAEELGARFADLGVFLLDVGPSESRPSTPEATLQLMPIPGLAFGGAGSEARDIVHRADLAAYQAKADGRSRLSIAAPRPLTSLHPSPQDPELGLPQDPPPSCVLR
jgi:hypothetical protein